MKAIEKKILFLLAFILFGMAISVQLRTTNTMRTLTQIDYAKSFKEYDEQLSLEKINAMEIKKQIDDLSQQKEQNLKHSLKKKNDSLLEEWSDIRLLAGFTKVRGKGIVIDVTDRQIKTDKPEYFVVHADDIIRLLNELKSAGAQAISVNEERILPSSEIVCTGPTIQINRNRYPAPFEIKAIGDQDLLLGVLNGSEIMTELKQFIKIQVSKNDKINIPGYNGDAKQYITGLEVVGK